MSFGAMFWLSHGKFKSSPLFCSLLFVSCFSVLRVALFRFCCSPSHVYKLNSNMVVEWFCFLLPCPWVRGMSIGSVAWLLLIPFDCMPGLVVGIWLFQILGIWLLKVTEACWWYSPPLLLSASRPTCPEFYFICSIEILLILSARLWVLCGLVGVYTVSVSN